MTEKPKGGLLLRARRLGGEISRLQVSTQAANTCYFLVLSFFPMLVLLLGMLR